MMRRIAFLTVALLALASAGHPDLAHAQAGNPFNPTGQTSLSVTTSSARAAFAAPTGPTALIVNTGTNTAYIKLGNAAVTAATTDTYLGAGCAFAFSSNGQTNVAAITASSTTTLAVTTGGGIPTLPNSGCAVSGGGSGVTSIAGTANQITASAATGAVTLSVPADFRLPGTINLLTLTQPATAATLTLANNSSLITAGAFATTLTSSATTNSTLPAGTHSLAPLDSPSFTGGITTPSLTLSGNISQAAWTTSGIRIVGVPVTLTDTTSTGTVAAAYTNVLGGNTIAATNATTFTNYYTNFLNSPVAGTNVTITNPWAAGFAGNIAVTGAVSIGGCAIGGNAVCATGPSALAGNTTITGLLNVSGASTFNGTMNIGNANFFQWTTRSALQSPSDGVLTISNNAGTDFSRLQLACQTSACPAIKRNGAGIDFRLADDSGYAAISAAGITGTTSNFSGAMVLSSTADILVTGPSGPFDVGISKYTGRGLNLGASALVEWYPAAPSGTPDLRLRRLGIANLVQGFAANATPVAQIFTLGEASVVGTSNNIGGSNGTIQCGLGTGTGTPCQLIFQTAAVTGSGTGAQTYATAMSITGAGAISMPLLATSSAAQTGTVCSGAGGLLTVDTTTTCLLSALKYKENIEPLDAGVAEVMRLRPVSYDLKPEFNPTKLGRQVGLIADEVYEIDQRLVGLDDKGRPHGVRYEQTVAVLVKAIQEQQGQIAALKARLDAANDNHVVKVNLK